MRSKKRLLINYGDNMRENILKKFVIATLAVCLLALSVHIVLTNLLTPIIQKLAAGINIAKPPYNFFITFFAFITEIIPAAVTVLIYYSVKDFLPTQNRVIKGVIFATVMLLMRGELIRQPIMNLLVGSTLQLVLLQEINIIIPNVLMGILVAVIMQPKDNTRF